MTPATKTESRNATLDLQARLKASVEKLEKAHDRAERLQVATSVVTKTGGNNLLHVAALHGAREILKELVGAIEERTDFEGCMFAALAARNKGGYTPLHYAASRGSLEMCKDIIWREDGFDFFHPLIHIRNNEKETPLFLAAAHGHKETFFFLHKVNMTSPPPEGTVFPWIRKNGDTILHCTIAREYFDLSFQIVDMYKDQHIATAANERGITPLHVLANKPSAFKSGTPFNWFSKVLYSYTTVEPLKRSSSIEETDFHFAASPTDEVHKTTLPENYGTCLNIYAILRSLVRRLLTADKLLDLERNSSRGQITNLPPNYATWMEFLTYALGICGYPAHHIKLKKKKHVWASQVMEELISEYYKPVTETDLDRNELMLVCDDISSPTNVKKDQQSQQGGTSETDDGEMMTPLLAAAKNGVIEMVTKILKDVPLAIHETTTDRKNILLVAVKNRQPRIFRELENHHARESLIQAVDAEGNNVLHLAAQGSKFRPWRIAGSAMQMQWDIKFYEFVKKHVPDHLIFQTNNKEEIPSDIFTQSRKQIVKDSSEWLKSTSESCSVVAALIAGVSFATSCSVPGGNNDVTGKPTLEGEPAFDAFAITSLISLCFSVTALVMFLAILTSRQQPKDYRRDLPLKLLFGLSFLFASIVSMLFSFYASYFFMLKDRMHKLLFIIYAATCLPMSVYAVAQFPLYWDLFTSIVTKVPESAHMGHLYMNIDAEEETSKKCICSCP